MSSSRSLLLASASPQRRAILEQLRIPFRVVPHRYEEGEERGRSPVELACAHARGKARSARAGVAEGPLLAADTVVAVDDRALGTPGHAEEAKAMLRQLSGRWHEVVSALCLLIRSEEVVEHDLTRVLFRPLSRRDIDAYVASGEWQGRAGGYAVQGLGASLVERIDGDYLTVVGLPGFRLLRLLSRRLPGSE
ncbi:MAG: septum formation protein Maf [Thermoleophilia bacterium]